MGEFVIHHSSFVIGNQPRDSPAIHTLPLSIALLSIWGASLLPIANCLSLAYPRLSERQPVGCHLSYLRSRYSHIIAHVHPLTAALVSPQTSAKRTRLTPNLRYAPLHPPNLREENVPHPQSAASVWQLQVMWRHLFEKNFYFFILHFWPLFRHFLLFLGHFLPFLRKVLF